MSIKDKYTSIISWTLFSVFFSFFLIELLNLTETLAWISRVLILLLLYVFGNFFDFYSNSDKKGRFITFLFILWLVIGFFRASIVAEGYWMWKSIIYQLTITLFYYVIISTSSNVYVIQSYFRLYWLYFIPILILSFLSFKGLNIDYVPFTFLVLFLKYIPVRKRVFLLLIIGYFFFSIYQRNDMVKIAVSLIIGISFLFIHKQQFLKVIKIARLLFLMLPFVFIFLAVYGSFNIFRMEEYIKGDYEIQVNVDGSIERENLKADTRTFIFENVFYTLKVTDSWLFGRSPAFGDVGVANYWGRDSNTGLEGRYGNEVGILDILLWYGVVGVILYFLIFLRASYLVIYKSNNSASKALGIYISFIWFWSFVWEKPMMQTFFLVDLIALGLCFSNKFRLMSDQEVKSWFTFIFKRSLIIK